MAPIRHITPYRERIASNKVPVSVHVNVVQSYMRPRIGGIGAACADEVIE